MKRYFLVLWCCCWHAHRWDEIDENLLIKSDVTLLVVWWWNIASMIGVIVIDVRMFVMKKMKSLLLHVDEKIYGNDNWCRKHVFRSKILILITSHCPWMEWGLKEEKTEILHSITWMWRSRKHCLRFACFTLLEVGNFRICQVIMQMRKT